jgi:hypothetical protein
MTNVGAHELRFGAECSKFRGQCLTHLISPARHHDVCALRRER